MKLALKLAGKGRRRHSAEPLVGAVVVAGNRPVGLAYAGEAYDQPAAQRAFEEAGQLATGATLYTNIEPCAESQDPDSHLERLIEYKPRLIVIGHRSALAAPASNRILACLKSAGVSIESGVCEHECVEANAIYYKYRATGMPFVTVKFAASLDGRIATSSGDSQWISGPSSLRFAHQLRSEHDAVLVGIGTVLADDPRLTVRLVNGHTPTRVVVDSSLRISERARVLADAKYYPTIIATTDHADLSRARRLEGLGAEVLVLKAAPEAALADSEDTALKGSGAGAGLPGNYAVNLESLFATLGQRKIASVLVEGGSAIITSLLAARTADRLVAVIAPKIIGTGLNAIGDLGIKRLQDAIGFCSIKTRRLGTDVIFDCILHAADSTLDGA